jgi:hypothetical protein
MSGSPDVAYRRVVKGSMVGKVDQWEEPRRVLCGAGPDEALLGRTEA